MTFVNGVELSVSIDGVSANVDGNVIHVLGYNIRPDKVLFNKIKSKFDKDYIERIAAIVAYLKTIKDGSLPRTFTVAKSFVKSDFKGIFS